MELVKIRAFLPVKLTELSNTNEALALEILRMWGNGDKPLRELWQLAHDGLEANVNGHN
ncbi:hypothetical protein ABFY60_15715 [Lysinibacillus pakistanensis]|uniref:hypothetical protein n=1 Tax=Lysinibacillus pakistanensis TaxID=759811 RepID=UPI003D2D26C4